MDFRSPSATNFSTGRINLLTVIDSPVRVDSSILALCSSIILISAGIMSPARSVTRSPGTRSENSILTFSPSLTTVVLLTTNLRSPARADSALEFWTYPMPAMIPMIMRMRAPSIFSPIARESKPPAIKM